MFFLADVQTGFGPFVSVYLTTQKWTQVDIGLVLSIGSIVGLIGQMPGGLIVDAARSERLVAATALVHAVFFGDDRYHIVITPVLCVLAAAALRSAEPIERESLTTTP